MKCKYILFFIILLTACRQKRTVQPSFYYWRTVYQQNTVENNYLNKLKCEKLYVRIMDLDVNLSNAIVPVAPINFKQQIPKHLEIVPVVFIVNNALIGQNTTQLKQLAYHISAFVKAKVQQAGQKDYQELQIDCDWTKTTRESYFVLLKQLKQLDQSKTLSSTLRLHQLKNQVSSGIPPVDKVLLMCYNMGNLRQYGTQNSILDPNEFAEYAGKNLQDYPLGIDVALPLFSWAVVFDHGNYAGISKRIKLADLQNPAMFTKAPNGLYHAKIDLPAFGIKKNVAVRYETSDINSIQKIAGHLSDNLSEKSINLVYYHLDEQLLKNYQIHTLEKINRLLH
jgi:hypothetical protein